MCQKKAATTPLTAAVSFIAKIGTDTRVQVSVRCFGSVNLIPLTVGRSSLGVGVDAVVVCNGIVRSIVVYAVVVYSVVVVNKAVEVIVVVVVPKDIVVNDAVVVSVAVQTGRIAYVAVDITPGKRTKNKYCDHKK
jgi:hypothetical protein